MNEEYLLQLKVELENKISSEVGKVIDETKKINDNFKKTGKTVDDFSKNASKNLRSFTDSINKAASASKIALIGISASAGLAIKKYADFEDSILKVQTVSNASFSDIKKSAEELSIAYRTNVNEILNGNYDLVSAMGDVSNSSEILAETLKLSKAGYASFGGTLNLTTKILSAYGIKTTEVSSVTDTLIQLQNKGKITIGELESQMGRVIPTAANFKVSLNDLSAAYALLTVNAFSAEQATTGLDALFNELGNSTTKAAEQFEALSGQTFQNFMKNGGSLEAVLKIMGEQAVNTGKSVDNIFGSVESKKAFSTLFNNFEGYKQKIKEINSANGTLNESYGKISKSANEQMKELQQNIDNISRKFGEALVPKLIELTNELNKINWEEKFSKENIDKIVTIGKELSLIATAILGINTAIKAVEFVKLIDGFYKIGIAAASANPYIAALVLAISALGLGINELKEMDLKNLADLEKLKKENDLLENKKELLKAIKADLENGVSNPEMISTVDGFSDLKKILESGDIEKGLSRINYELNSINNEKIVKERLEYSKLMKEMSNTQPKISGRSSNAKELTELEKKIAKMYEKMPSLWEGLGLNNTEILKEKLSIAKNIMADAIKGGADKNTAGYSQLKNIIADLNIQIETEEKLKEKQKELRENIRKTTEEYENFKKTFNDSLKNIDIQSKIFGLTEEESLENKAELLGKTYAEFFEKGWEAKDPKLVAEIKAKWDEARSKQDELYEKNEANKRNEEELKRKIEEQSKAYSDVIDNARALGDSLYKTADLLENEFLKSLAATVNSFESLASASFGKDGKGGLFGNAGTLSKGFSMDSLASIGSFLGSGIGVATAIGSMLGKKDKSKEIEAKNQKELKKYEDNTNALEKLSETIKNNTATLNNFAQGLISNISKNPTLNRISKGEDAFSSMANAMLANKSFSDLDSIVKGTKKTGGGLFKKSKRVDTFTNLGISDSQLLNATGFSGVNSIEELTFEQLKKFSSNIENFTTETLKSMTGKNITESNIDGLKGQIKEYIHQVESLQREQADLFKSATLESFRGVNYADKKALKEQYINMYKDLGLDVTQYENVINELVEANSVLITSMDNVRESIIEGNKTFAESMSSYFSDIIYNAKSVMYDVMFSDLDEYMNESFKNISEKLVDLKKQGGSIDPKELFKDFDFNKILDGQKLQEEMKKQADALKKYLLEMGLDIELVESILGETTYKEKIDKMSAYLKESMSKALETKNFSDFSKTLGESLYNNVKESLVKAFSETKLYQQLIEKFMITDDFVNSINGAGSFEDAFKLIQEQLKKYMEMLEGNGLGFDFVGSGDSSLTNNQDNGKYFTESTKEITIKIEQNFNGSFYSEQIMRDRAKEGAYEAIEELNNRGQILTSF